MDSLLFFLLAVIPHDGNVSKQTVDLIEKNNFYDCEGKQVFCQWIFWEWDGSRHQVIAWRLDKPEFSFQEHSCLLIWAEQGKLRQVQGRYWRETFTQFDPEVYEREFIPKECRKGLRP